MVAAPVLAGDLVLPRGWTLAEPDEPLPPSTRLWRSADRRCSYAIVSAGAEASSGVDADPLFAALAAALEPAQIRLEKSDKGAVLSHPSLTGEARLERDNSSGAWQLRACFHRKKDANVCEIQCAKLLGSGAG